MLEAVPQNVNDPVPSNLALQPRQKLSPRRSIDVQFERFGDVLLSGREELRQLDEVTAYSRS